MFGGFPSTYTNEGWEFRCDELEYTRIGTGAEVFTSGEGGTGFIDKKQNSVVVDENVLVKLYGKVTNPKEGSGFVFLLTTHPDGHITDEETPTKTNGYYETYFNVAYEDHGKYSVDVRKDSKNSIGFNLIYLLFLQ